VTELRLVRHKDVASFSFLEKIRNIIMKAVGRSHGSAIGEGHFLSALENAAAQENKARKLRSEGISGEERRAAWQEKTVKIGG
jgi:hypothetical protein